MKLLDEKYNVTEGIEGYWFYHISLKDKFVALCGASIMHTDLPLSSWGNKGHLGERYCDECVKQAQGREKDE